VVEGMRMIPPRGSGVNGEPARPGEAAAPSTQAGTWGPRRQRGYRVSLALTLVRLVLAPALAALAHSAVPGVVLAAALVAGFVSDVLDGVVARRADAVTPFLRRLDSSVDTVFYLGVAYAAWIRHPAALGSLAVPIVVVIAAEALNYLVALLKFGREASYHARSAKLWGLLLFLALIALLGTGDARLLPIALAAGILAQAETLAITIALRSWRHDVPSLWNAWRVRT
jgi:phosphatidylglycerophosphate synthase